MRPVTRRHSSASGTDSLRGGEGQYACWNAEGTNYYCESEGVECQHHGGGIDWVITATAACIPTIVRSCMSV